jgi:hypothetical protein
MSTGIMTTMKSASGTRSMWKPSCHISMVMRRGSEKKMAPANARARPMRKSRVVAVVWGV